MFGQLAEEDNQTLGNHKYNTGAGSDYYDVEIYISTRLQGVLPAVEHLGHMAAQHRDQCDQDSPT